MNSMVSPLSIPKNKKEQRLLRTADRFLSLLQEKNKQIIEFDKNHPDFVFRYNNPNEKKSFSSLSERDKFLSFCTLMNERKNIWENISDIIRKLKYDQVPEIFRDISLSCHGMDCWRSDLHIEPKIGRATPKGGLAHATVYNGPFFRMPK